LAGNLYGTREVPEYSSAAHQEMMWKLATASGFTSDYKRGIASGKIWRGAALGQIVKGWERGR
jgi:hypothetical protein